MRKLLAILFLGLILFSGFGYRLVFRSLEEKSEQTLVAALDRAQFAKSNLLTVRIPLDLPYQTNWSNPQRYDDELVIDGRIYQTVDRKVEDGYLIVQLIPNERKMGIRDLQQALTQQLLDLNADENTPASKSPVKSFKVQISDWEEIQSVQHGFAGSLTASILHPFHPAFTAQDPLSELLRPPHWLKDALSL